MHKTLSVIDLSAIEHNSVKVREMIGSRFFWAVVKADAYGHGAVEVSRRIENIVDGFCVAIVDEGVQLRVCGITKPILVFAPPLDTDDAERMRRYNLIATVTDAHSAHLARGCLYHIAVNTGMNRYGSFGKGLEDTLKNCDLSGLVGAYSHMYFAEDSIRCQNQLAYFKQALRLIYARVGGTCDEGAGNKIQAHLSASGGILRGEEYLLDGVRCGIMLYGYTPHGFKAEGLTPALKVYARRACETEFLGDGVGYGIADRKYDRLYTYRLGYADGFFRNVPLGEKTLCMDAFISCENVPLLPVFTDANGYAERAGTISYEVLCAVTARSERVYIG